MDVRRVGFIGGGVIAEAVATGLVEKAGIKKDDIMISDQSPSRREYLAKGDWKVTSENKDTAEFDIIFISLNQDEVTQELKKLGNSTSILVSLVAGVTLRTLDLNSQWKLVRAITNVNAQNGSAVTAICSNAIKSNVKAAELVKELMSKLGKALVVKEDEMNAITAVIGSGVAYSLMFIEALAEEGILQGLSRDVAKMVAEQTVLGAAQLMQDSDDHPAKLRDDVEVGKGSTLAGVRTLECKGLREALHAAVEASDEQLHGKPEPQNRSGYRY
ncbi:hypothetical protein NDN08_003119 [Rhodosorus marinus]|uniref:Pyrroline-5-carboxylate reductase n=1 Tax=Rhodosorus marinus TaxID=101924 RepID=A0AAV8V1E7_9RHOD|nr:hypothetical protein NDN08_003119 [Rhodosorus marinus]